MAPKFQKGPDLKRFMVRVVLASSRAAITSGLLLRLVCVTR